MNEVEAVKAAIANTTDFDGDRMASRYADSELHAVALAAIAALDAVRGDQVARVEALSDNAELLTIAWMDGSHRSTKAHRARIAELEAEVERLRGMLKPQWFYAGEDQSSDQCRFSIDEVLEDELCGWGPPKTGKHVVHVSTALPGPDIWAVVRVLTDEEKDARQDDEPWLIEEYATEEEARTALGASHDADA